MTINKPDLFTIFMSFSIFLHFSVFVSSYLAVKNRNDDLNSFKVINFMPVENSPVKNFAARPRKAAKPKEISVSNSNITKPQEEMKKEEPEQEADEGDYSGYQPYSDLLMPPELLTELKPVYPQSAKAKGLETEVLIEVFIDKNGKPKKTVILRSGGPDFDFSIMQAMQASTFKPAYTKNGAPVAVRVIIPFKFELE